jgi:hypothetical protein
LTFYESGDALNDVFVEHSHVSVDVAHQIARGGKLIPHLVAK